MGRTPQEQILESGIEVEEITEQRCKKEGTKKNKDESHSKS
jgi:hypothetical protein